VRKHEKVTAWLTVTEAPASDRRRKPASEAECEIHLHRCNILRVGPAEIAFVVRFRREATLSDVRRQHRLNR
jgi:hypothetical protein